ncbi:hypothetical protein [Sphingobacterium sp. SGL-16]|uniref:hypothetical protein n=1 Tax=Sphingobacterium sp. SGL-16 TaxID=2710883 RepID=UPI0019D07F27|nr:hypothetical protein [Sphingobacterium sp. SGL-16]
MKISYLTILLCLICFLSILTSSCTKDNIENESQTEVDVYYVKYKISTSGTRIFSNWSVTTPTGLFTKKDYNTRNWEGTFGPLKKGFNCVVQIGSGEPTIQIYISKNNEPFALKSSSTGKSLSYKIQ